MRIKHILFLIFFLFFFLQTDGKSSTLLYSNDKTQHIIKNIKLDSLCIVPPNIFWAKIDKEEMKRFEDSLFNTNSEYASFWNGEIGEGRYQAGRLSVKSQKNFNYVFRKIPHYFASLPPKDVSIVNEELKKIEKIVKYKSVDNIIIPDRLFSVLSKYPANQYLLTDIIEFYSTPTGHFSTSFLRIQCFLINIKSKQIEFYDYRILQDPNILMLPNFKEVFSGISGQIRSIRKQFKRAHLKIR